MLSLIENFLKHYPNTIAALTSFSTLLAVIVSLYLAQSSRYSKIIGNVDIRIITQDTSIYPGSKRMQGQPTNSTLIISVDVTNQGPYEVHLKSFGSFAWVPTIFLWKFTPYCAINPLYPDLMKMDCSITPGKDRSFILTDGFSELITSMQEMYTKKYGSFIAKLLIARIDLYIYTSGRQVIRAKVGPELRKFFQTRQLPTY